MALIDTQGLREDAWTHLDDEAPLPASGPVLVSLARFQKNTAALLEHEGEIGVRLKSDDEPSALSEYIDKLALIAVEFPKFADGRGYSTARLLRDRYAYRGELRAFGDVLRDQLFYMRRCGFDSFDLAPGKDPEEALQAFNEYSVTYQGAADEARPLYRRHARE